MGFPDKESLLSSPCWVLLGPTAAGKTELTCELGRRWPVEIVSVDSMQIYRGMDIGTAKPSSEQRREIPHHMIDVVDPEDEFDVSRFREMALGIMESIRKRDNIPLLVCGTPLYLKALLWGLFEGPGADSEVRERLRKEAELKGREHLHQRLAEVDPESGQRVDPNDLRRIVRALEVYELTGRPISQRQDQFDGPPDIEHISVGLEWPREMLYERINQRVDRMLEEGLVEEVQELQGRLGRQASQAVGYKELMAHFEGDISFEEAVRLIKRNSRHLAKQQLNWFQRFPVPRWVKRSHRQSGDECLEKVQNSFLNLARQDILSYD